MLTVPDRTRTRRPLSLGPGCQARGPGQLTGGGRLQAVQGAHGAVLCAVGGVNWSVIHYFAQPFMTSDILLISLIHCAMQLFKGS